MPAKTAAPSLHTAEALLQEMIEGSRKCEKLLSQLRRTDSMSPKAFDLLGDLWIEAEVVRSKAEHSKEEIDAIMDAMPDDED